MNSAVQVDLSGKQALVTGGARGLGAAIARPAPLSSGSTASASATASGPVSVRGPRLAG